MSYKQHGRQHGPNGSDPIIGDRRVDGAVDGGSTTPHATGSGDWTVDTDFAGTWTITIDPPFDNPPTVDATENETSTLPPNYVRIGAIAVDTIVIYTYEASSRTLASDIGFNFIAVGT